MNKVMLMGRLTRSPKLSYSQSATSTAVCRYSLAVNRTYKRDGEQDADFINIIAFGKRGEFANNYFKKGQMVAVVGRLQVRSYDDHGTNRWVTEVIAEEQHFAESRASFESRNTGSKGELQGGIPETSDQQALSTEGYYQEDLDDDDLPF